MATIPKPSGYIKRAVPRSNVEAISAKAHDQAKTVVKSALEGYIRSFMNTDGKNRSYVESLSNRTLNFITDKSINDDKDPRKRRTQLTRLYEEVEEQTPAILLVDNSFEWTPNSLGEITGSRILHDDNGEPWWLGQYQITARIGLSVAVLTSDQDTTDGLGTFLALIFKQIRNLAGGSRIVSDNPEDSWEVRLPLNPEVEPTTSMNTKEDPKDQLWTTSLSLMLDFEDNFVLRQRFIGWSDESKLKASVNNPVDKQPIIHADSTTSINSKLQFKISKLQPAHKIIIDNPNLALLDKDNFVLTPRRLGTAKIQILDPRKSQGPGTMNASTVIAEKEIKIIL